MDMRKCSYYDFMGNEVDELKNNKDVVAIDNSNNLFRVKKDGCSYIFDLNRRKFIKAKNPLALYEGMILFYDNDSDKTYYYNEETGKVIGPYKGNNDFNEGVAIVEKNGVSIIVDKNGKEYRVPSNFSIMGSEVSEGVYSVIDEKSRVRGYFYNPIGHGKYVYNQKAGQINDLAYSNILDEAQSLFDKKKYAQAMNKYYQLMMLRPKDNSNFNNYAVCLYNLGKYDEALTAIDVTLEYWPENEFAIDTRQSIVNQLKEEERRRQYEENVAESSSNSIWDAIGNFVNVLATINGNYNVGSAYVPSYSSQSSVVVSNGNYKNQYDMWARIAEKHFNSITNLGASWTKRNGEKSGSAGQGMSGGNYVSMKRSFREAQSEMRKIRRQASKEGITIPQSKWETATISY